MYDHDDDDCIYNDDDQDHHVFFRQWTQSSALARERVVETRKMRLRMGKLSAGGDDYDNDGDLIDNDVDNEDDNGDDGTPS